VTEMIKRNLPLKPVEAAIILAACRGGRPADLRDQAMLTLCLGTGMLRSSMVGIHIDDIQADGIDILIKGKRTHRVPIGAEIRAALNPWLVWLRGGDCGESDFLFRSISREHVDGSIDVGNALGEDGFYRAVTSRARKAGLDRQVGPLVFRHTFLAWCRELEIATPSIIAVTGYSTDGRSWKGTTVLTGDAVTSAVLNRVKGG